MQHRVWLWLCIVPALAQLGCTSIQCGANSAQFIEQYDAFIEEVIEADMRVTDSKWPIYDDSFETYLVDCYPAFKEEMTQGDRQHVISQGMRYYYERYGSHMIEELNDPRSESAVILRNEMREIWQADEFFRELAEEDWEAMIDTFLNDLEEWKNLLQDVIEEK